MMSLYFHHLIPSFTHFSNYLWITFYFINMRINICAIFTISNFQ